VLRLSFKGKGGKTGDYESEFKCTYIDRSGKKNWELTPEKKKKKDKIEI